MTIKIDTQGADDLAADARYWVWTATGLHGWTKSETFYANRGRALQAGLEAKHCEFGSKLDAVEKALMTDLTAIHGPGNSVWR